MQKVLTLFVAAFVASCPALAQRPVFDGITVGAGGATLDLTAMTAAGKAIGDGVTDASPAFSAVAALAMNATVTVPCGTYLLKTTQQFVIKHDLNLVGAGRQCVTITFPPSTIIPDVVFNFDNNYIPGTSSMSGITIDLANVRHPDPPTIGVVWANHHFLDFNENAIINAHADSLYYSVVLWNETRGYRITNNILNFDAPSNLSGNGCVQIGYGTGLQSVSGFISGNIVTNCAFSIDSSRTVVSGNNFDNWSSWGGAIFMPPGPDGNTGNVVANNVARGRTASLRPGDNLSCMEIGSYETLILGNALSQCPGNGIDFFGPHISVVNNIVNGAGRASPGAGGIVARQSFADTYAAGAIAQGGIVEGNVVMDDGSGTLAYGFADQTYDTSGQGCNLTTQVCSPQIGINNFSGTLGPMQVRSLATYATTYAGMAVQAGTSTGSANTQALGVTTPPIIPTTLVAGLTIAFKPGFANTGAATLDVKTGSAANLDDFLNAATKTTGALAINKVSGGALVALTGGELLINVPTTVTYNGTVWVWGPR